MSNENSVINDITKKMFDNIAMGISIISPNMEIIWFNKTFKEWLPQINPEDKPICYQAFYNPPKEAVCSYCPTIKAFKTGEAQTAEADICVNERKYNVTAVPIKDDTGKVIFVIETVEDITERSLAEKKLIEEKNFSDSLINILPTIFFLFNEQGKIIRWSKAVEEVTQYCAEEINQMHPLNFFAVKDKNRVEEKIKEVFVNGEASAEADIVTKYGKTLSYFFKGLRIRIGQENHLLGVGVDISDRCMAEDKLKYREKFESLINVLSKQFIDLAFSEVDGVVNNALKTLGEFIGIERSYIFLFFNGTSKWENTHRWFGQGVKSDINKFQNLSMNKLPWIAKKINKFEIVCFSSLNDLPDAANLDKKELVEQGVKSLVMIPLVYHKQLMGILGFDLTTKEKLWDDDDINMLKMVGEIFVNALSRKSIEQQLESVHKELLKTNKRLKTLGLRDPLTGLYNHRYLEEIIEAELFRAQRYAQPLSAIMIDVDYFKSINNVYGPQFGDLVLKQLARQLKQMVRKYDVVIRYSGEEFVIVSSGSDRARALHLSQRLLDSIGMYNFGNDEQTARLKLSIAVISYPEDKVLRGMDLIRLADQVLDKAKQDGGARVYSLLNIDKKALDVVPEKKDVQEFNFLREKIDKLTKRANQSLMQAVFAFAKTIELKDSYTGSHAERTVKYAVMLAKAVGLSNQEVERIREAALLHDLGKIGVSEKVLRKKSKLTKKEFSQIKKHPQIGADIVRPIHFLHDIIPLIVYHHERWDGKGYPAGLKGEEIPLGARIISVADVYHALTSNRPYRKAYSKIKAIQIIKSGSGTQFDPHLVEAFLKVIKNKE